MRYDELEKTWFLTLPSATFALSVLFSCTINFDMTSISCLLSEADCWSLCLYCFSGVWFFMDCVCCHLSPLQGLNQVFNLF